MSEASKFFFLNLDNDDLQRFDLSKFMKFEHGIYDPLTSFAFEEIRNLPIGGNYIVNGKNYRPDWISFEIYETDQFWWAIMLYNGLVSVNEIQHGMELTYPLIGSLEDFYFDLKIRQNRSDRD